MNRQPPPWLVVMVVQDTRAEKAWERGSPPLLVPQDTQCFKTRSVTLFYTSSFFTQKGDTSREYRRGQGSTPPPKMNPDWLLLLQWDVHSR